jgi:stage II sporulation protein AB (anti-sigma F factor)
MTVVNYINIEIPSKSTNEGLARAVAACFAAQLDPTLEEVNDIKTAVSEAVTNCIRLPRNNWQNQYQRKNI